MKFSALIILVIGFLFITGKLAALDYYVYDDKTGKLGQKGKIYLFTAAKEKPNDYYPDISWQPIKSENLPKDFDESTAFGGSKTVKPPKFYSSNAEKEPKYMFYMEIKRRLDVYDIIYKQSQALFKEVEGNLDVELKAGSPDEPEQPYNPQNPNPLTKNAYVSKLSIVTAQHNPKYPDDFSKLIIKYSNNFEVRLKVAGKATVHIPDGNGNMNQKEVNLEGEVVGQIAANRGNLYITGRILYKDTETPATELSKTNGKEIGKFKGSITFKIKPDSTEISNGMFCLYGEGVFNKDTRLNIVKEGKFSGKDGTYELTARAYDRNYLDIGVIIGKITGKIIDDNKK